MNEIKKLAGQTVIYGMGTIVPRFLNYILLTPFYTRQLTKPEFGVITELYAWMVFMQIVLTYGMETGFFRFARNKPDFERTYSTSLISLTVTSVMFLVLVLIFINPVSAFFNYPDNTEYIKMFAAILAVDAICAIPFARLRNEGRPLLFSAVKISNVAITVVLVYFLLKVAPGLYEKSNGWFREIFNPDIKVAYVFAANLAGSIFTLLFLVPVALKVKLVFDRELWKRMMIYSFPLLIAGLSGSINDALDKVILRRLVGEESGLATVGEYGAGYKVAVLMALFIQMFRYAAEPFFFERSSKENAKESYRDVMKYFIIIMLLVFMMINLYMPVVKVLLGKEFRDSLVVVPVVSMAYLLYGIYINHSIWYKLNDLTRFGIYITLAGALVTVAINLIFVPFYGYMASAWAHIASYLVMLLLSFAWARKYYFIEYELYKLLPYFIIAIVFVVADIFIHFESDLLRITLNTLYILLFIVLAHKKDRILNIIRLPRSR